MEMYKLKNYLLAIGIIFLSNCERESVINNNGSEYNYDTIKPLPYFPVYPGSYWTYLINDSLIIDDTTSNTYTLHRYYNGQDTTSSVYVPFLNGRPIYQYDKIEWVKPPFGDYFKKWPILRETIGYTFVREWLDQRIAYDRAEYVIVYDKYSENGDSTIVLKGYWGQGPDTSTLNHISWQFYIKDIGLAKHYIIDTLENDTVYKKELIDYLINE